MQMQTTNLTTYYSNANKGAVRKHGFVKEVKGVKELNEITKDTVLAKKDCSKSIKQLQTEQTIEAQKGESCENKTMMMMMAPTSGKKSWMQQCAAQGVKVYKHWRSINWNCLYANDFMTRNNIIRRRVSKSPRQHSNSIGSTTMLLLYCFSHFLLLVASLPSSQATCRDEDSRACEAICTASDDLTKPPFNCTIRALVLLPDDEMYVASLRRVLPILKVAEQHIRSTSLVPSHIDFEWLARNEKCDASLAMIKAMDGITKDCAHVIFGPVCDYSLAAVSRITKYFNSQGTPLISVGGSTFDFEQKKTSCGDEFYMLLRTGMLSFETLSELTINVMKRHNWSHSIFYYERDGQKSVAGMHTCYLMMKSLGIQMRKENMTFAQYPLDPKLTNRTEEVKREVGNKHASE